MYTNSNRRWSVSCWRWTKRNGFSKWSIESCKTSIAQPSSGSAAKNGIRTKCGFSWRCLNAYTKWCCFCWWHRTNVHGDFILHRIQIHIPLFEHRLWYFRRWKLRESALQTLYQHQSSHDGTDRRPILRLRFANVRFAGNVFWLIHILFSESIRFGLVWLLSMSSTRKPIYTIAVHYIYCMQYWF